MGDIKPIFDSNRKISFFKKIKFKYFRLQDVLSIYSFSDFISSIYRLIYFFPIIWRDRSYSYDGYYKLLKRKAEHQLKLFKIYSSYESEDILNIEKFIEIIDRIDKDAYFDKYYDDLKSKYPFFKKGFKKVENNCSQMVIFDNRTNLQISDIDNANYEKDSQEFMRLSELDKMNDLDEFAKFFTEGKIEKFWY